MLNKKQILDIFKMLGLSSESKRRKILSQGVVKSKIKQKDVNYIIIDNTSLKKEEETKSAKLE